jgi:succinoglycan biosynthesis protein ExoA
MNRLQHEGHVFVYVPDAYIFRSQRANYRAYLKQVFTYGRGRMDQNYAHPEGFKALHIAPSLFLIYFLSLMLVRDVFYFLPGMIYALLALIFSAASAYEAKNPLYFIVMPFLFLSLHLGYGAGFVWGFIKGLRPGRPAHSYLGEIALKRVDPWRLR